MQGDKIVLTGLNSVLRYHLTAINQAFLHARMARNWGYKKLDHFEYRWSIRAMKQSDAIIERILFLEGLPNLQDLGKLHIGETVPEIFQCDEAMLSDGGDILQVAILSAEKSQDYVTRSVLVHQQRHLQEQMDDVKAYREQIELMGVENFLQNILCDPE